jgi:PPM family protein phosphatase
VSMRLWFSTLSDIGMVRAKNDDSAYAGPRLLAVADGMGGPPGGDIASALTIDALRELDVTSPAESPEREAERLTEAALLANNRISARVDSESRLHGMGTTLTAALFTGQALVFGHIGDSRAYLYRPADGEPAATAAAEEPADAATAALPGLVQLTKDHTFVQSLVDEGQITPEQAETHSHRSWLIRAVDGRADNDPDTFFVDLVTDDRVLLCSDGLTGFVTIPAIRDHLAAAPDPAQACQALVSLALDAGAPDNVTCVVAFVVDVADDPAGPTGIGAASAPVTADVLDSQHPMLVGAVAALVGDDSGEITMSEASGTALFDHAEDDETRAHRSSEQAEADRYAPRLQSRWRRLRRIVVALAVVAILVIAGGIFAYTTMSSGPMTAADYKAKAIMYLGQMESAGSETSATMQLISSTDAGERAQANAAWDAAAAQMRAAMAGIRGLRPPAEFQSIQDRLVKGVDATEKVIAATDTLYAMLASGEINSSSSADTPAIKAFADIESDATIGAALSDLTAAYSELKSK